MSVNGLFGKTPLWLVATIALLLVTVAACGKKGPPVAPDRPPLPKVADLKGRLDGDAVNLVWTAAGADLGVQRYAVMRSEKVADAQVCEGCPLVFRKVGEAGIDRDTQNVEFTDTVSPGAVYTYQVQAVGASGDLGPGSNPVVIDRMTPGE